jgi:hypothetical protein
VKNKRIYSLIIFITIVVASLIIYVGYEKTIREEFLISTLENYSQVESQDYKIASSSVTKFGYIYELEFLDEPHIKYGFYVKETKENQYYLLYYSYGVDGNYNRNAKRDQLFSQTINNFL